MLDAPQVDPCSGPYCHQRRVLPHIASLDPYFVRSFVIFSSSLSLSTGAHSILVTYIVVLFAWPRPSTESETALSPFLFACPLPQVLRSLRFPSSRSHSFRNVALDRAFSDPWNTALVLSIYLYPSVFLNSHGDFLSSSQLVSDEAEQNRRRAAGPGERVCRSRRKPASAE